MNNQSLIILAIGAFVGLIVTVAAIDQYLQDEHPATEVSGLFWRIENAFSRVKDLEAVLQVTDEGDPTEPLRMVVRYLHTPIPAMSIRYLRPDAVKEERFVIQNDQLSHYLPQENLVIIKRWVGAPLAALGLFAFDLSDLKEDWADGRVTVEIVQDTPGFAEDLFPTPIALAATLAAADSGESAFSSVFSMDRSPMSFSFSPNAEIGRSTAALCWEPVSALDMTSSLGGSYVLEVRDSRSDELLRMIWIDRETFLVHKVVVFEAGQRASTILVERIEIDQGLIEEEILTLPTRGVETIRG